MDAAKRQARKEYMREYYKANPLKFNPKTPESREKKNSARRAKYQSDAEYRNKHKASVKEWQAANPEKRKSMRLRQYGLSMDDFKAMMDAQSGKCLICGFSDTSDPNIFPVVDHCHDSERVRGLLCMPCNQGIGKFKDSPTLLMAAAAYLSRS